MNPWGNLNSGLAKLEEMLPSILSLSVCAMIHMHTPPDMILKSSDMVIDLPAEVSAAATAAKHAITTGSLLFPVESLWPVDPVKLASLAGAIYGLMLCVLPAYVRGWFSDLRDRSISSLVESFTRVWCSPPLIANELSQVFYIAQ